MLGPSLRSKEKKVESKPACALHYMFLSIPKLTSQKDCVEALKYVPLDQPSLASHCVGIQQALALATKHATTRRNMAETHNIYRIVLRRRDTKESTCLLWDITTEKSGLCCYAVHITQNTYVKK